MAFSELSNICKVFFSVTRHVSMTYTDIVMLNAIVRSKMIIVLLFSLLTEPQPALGLAGALTDFTTGIFLVSTFSKPLPDMPILGSSNSAANKDMMSKIWTNGDTII